MGFGALRGQEVKTCGFFTQKCLPPIEMVQAE
jgi:hypothetical protein